MSAAEGLDRLIDAEGTPCRLMAGADPGHLTGLSEAFALDRQLNRRHVRELLPDTSMLGRRDMPIELPLRHEHPESELFRAVVAERAAPEPVVTRIELPAERGVPDFLRRAGQTKPERMAA